MFGFGYLISLLFKCKIGKAQKWTDFKRWARAQSYELHKTANAFMKFIGVMGLLLLAPLYKIRLTIDLI